jgi:hypothetical protein
MVLIAISLKRYIRLVRHAHQGAWEATTGVAAASRARIKVSAEDFRVVVNK